MSAEYICQTRPRDGFNEPIRPMTTTQKNYNDKTPVDAFLNRKIEERIATFTEREARRPDGTIDEELAARIRWEVGRRGETGKQIDIYEPLRWTGIKAAASVASVAATKVIADRLKGKTPKQILWSVEAAVVIKTAIDSAVDLTRLYPRWLAGMEGGKNTAVKLYRDCPPDEDAPPPPTRTR